MVLVGVPVQQNSGSRLSARSGRSPPRGESALCHISPTAELNHARFHQVLRRDCRDCRDALPHLIASTIGPVATCAIGAKSFKPWQ